MNEKCYRCSSTQSVIRDRPSTHRVLECAYCGAFFKYLPKPTTKAVEDAIIKNPKLATMTRAELIEKVVELTNLYETALDFLHRQNTLQKHKEIVSTIFEGNIS